MFNFWVDRFRLLCSILEHGNWGPWSNWTECESTCGISNRTRFRLCNKPVPQYGGNLCPEHNKVEKIACYREPCKRKSQKLAVKIY